MTAILRAMAILALFGPIRLASLVPQLFNADPHRPASQAFNYPQFGAASPPTGFAEFLNRMNQLGDSARGRFACPFDAVLASDESAVIPF